MQTNKKRNKIENIIADVHSHLISIGQATNEILDIINNKNICKHKKSLLGLLDRETKKEQWYCPICKKVYLKRRKK